MLVSNVSRTWPPKELATGIKLPKQSLCEGVAGKMSQKPFKSAGEIHSKKKLQLVHSGVCEPMSTDSVGGNKYFVMTSQEVVQFIFIIFTNLKYHGNSRNWKLTFTVIVCGLRIGTLRRDN